MDKGNLYQCLCAGATGENCETREFLSIFTVNTLSAKHNRIIDALILTS